MKRSWPKAVLIIVVLGIMFIGMAGKGCPWAKDDDDDIIAGSSGALPKAVSNLIATRISSSQIDLIWTDNSDNEDGFKIERKTLSTDYSLLTTLAPDIISHSDTGLTGDTTYCYKVKAYNSAGESSYSNETWNSTDTWTWSPTSVTGTPPAPSERTGHAAIWTGDVMIIWGGGLGYLNDGSLYYPITDTWNTGITLVDAPSERSPGPPIWTGTEMIIWGGYDWTGDYLNTGAKYNSSTDTWEPITTTDAPSARTGFTTIWTGAEMVIWGGKDSSGVKLNSGAKYYPITDTWVSITTTNAPLARYNHTGVWAGQEMIIWGGYDANPETGVTNTGAKYYPITDTWVSITAANAPSARYAHRAVWTGTEMLIWGGIGGDYLNTGAKYNPSTNTWAPITTINAPSARSVHATVWTGTEMIIWGGYDGNDLNTGARYKP